MVMYKQFLALLLLPTQSNAILSPSPPSTEFHHHDPLSMNVSPQSVPFNTQSSSSSSHRKQLKHSHHNRHPHQFAGRATQQLLLAAPSDITDDNNDDHNGHNSGTSPNEEPEGIWNAEGQKLVIIKFRDAIGTVPSKKSREMGKTSSEKCEEIVAAQGGSIVYVYATAFNGCAAYLPVATSAINVQSYDQEIEYITDDLVIAVDATTTDEEETLWGLDRMNQCSLPLDGKHTPLNATGVKVYILDTGIMGSHDEFQGVIDSSSNCHHDANGENTPLVDGVGHGTHIASTACGNTYGVARGCNLCSVKVTTSTGRTSMKKLIAGLDHVINNCAVGERCVVNVGINGAQVMPAFNTAVASVVKAGITVVASAGNGNKDACETSPASEPLVIAVGATTPLDTMSHFSNYGSCVDAFAPGSGIKGASTTGNSDAISMSGTSMASPHVAGLAAGILFNNNTLSPPEVLIKIQESLTGPISDPNTTGVGLATTKSSCKSETFSPTPCPGVYLEIYVKPDKFPDDITWTLKNECSGEFQKNLTEKYVSGAKTDVYCIPHGKYIFKIEDEHGDGICCREGNGEYWVKMDGEKVASGAEFKWSEETSFGLCPTTIPESVPVTTSPTTTSPTTTSPTTTSPTTTSPTTTSPTTTSPTTTSPTTTSPTTTSPTTTSPTTTSPTTTSPTTTSPTTTSPTTTSPTTTSPTTTSPTTTSPTTTSPTTTSPTTTSPTTTSPTTTSPTTTSPTTTSPTESPPWKIKFQSVSVDFNAGNIEEELLLTYEVGKRRKYKSSHYAGPCINDKLKMPQIEPPGVITKRKNSTTESANSPMLTLELGYDFNKSLIAGSNIWNDTTSQILFCQVLQLVEEHSQMEEDLVIEEDIRDVTIGINSFSNFSIGFNLVGAIINTENQTTSLSNFISSYICSGDDTMKRFDKGFELGPNEQLHVCFVSKSTDVEISKVISMVINGTGALGSPKELTVLADGEVSIPAITSLRYENATVAVCATRVPINMFDYERADAKITIEGTVALNLRGDAKKRQLLIEDQFSTKNRNLQKLDNAVDEEVQFGISVNLKRSDIVKEGHVSLMNSASKILTSIGSLVVVAYVIW